VKRSGDRQPPDLPDPEIALVLFDKLQALK
jgi:hypothetical protein